MNESLKQNMRYAGFALIGSLATITAVDNKVKYVLPEGSLVSYEDNCGTDGSDPSRVYVVVKIPDEKGELQETRIRKDEISDESLPLKEEGEIQ